MARTKNILKQKTPQAVYEAACQALKRPVKTLKQFSAFYGKEEGLAHFALHRITTVIKAVKKGHQFDWGNYQERKHYPWFNMPNNAGSGFSLGDVYCDYTRTDVGARLSSITDADARAIATIFEEDYKKWLVE